MAYDAGTAFIQIVPSFQNIEGALKRGVREIADNISGAVSDALPDGLAEGAKRAERQARESGKRTADRYHGALVDQLQRKAGLAAVNLGNLMISTDIDDSALERRANGIGDRLQSISTQQIEPGFDTRAAIAEIQQLGDELEQMQRRAKDGRLVFDATEALKPIREIGRLTEQMDRRGREAGGNFLTGFQQAAQQAQQAIADIEVDVDLDIDHPARQMAQLREQLGHQSSLVVPTDVDEDRALQEMRLLLARLDEMARTGPTVQIRSDASAAATKLRGFLDGLDEQARTQGRDAGRKYIGAYAEAIRAEAHKAAATAGDFDPSAQVSDKARAARIELAGIAQELRGIGDRVGIDLSTEQAQEHVSRLLADVRRLQAQAEDDHELKFNAELTGDLLGKIAELGTAAGLAARRGGQNAGDEFSGAFLRELRGISERAQAQLGEVDLGVDVDADPVRVRIAELKAELGRVNEQLRLGVDTEGAHARLLRLLEEIRTVRREAGKGIELDFNLSGLEQELAKAELLERQSRQRQAAQGGRDAGAYATAFRETLSAAASTLPDFDVHADVTPAVAEIAAVRTLLQNTADLTIGVDLSTGEALAELERLQSRLRALVGDQSVDVRIRSDAAEALARLERFADGAGKIGEQAGERLRGAFIRQLHGISEQAQAQIGQIDVDVDADLDGVRVQVAALRREMRQLSTNLSLGIDVAGAHARLLQILEEIREIRREAGDDIELNYNLAGMERALGEVETLERQSRERRMKQSAREAGAYAQAYKQMWSAAADSLPDFKINVDSTPAQIEIARLRALMQQQADLTLGVDLSDEQAVDDAIRIRAAIQAILTDRTVEINVKSDLHDVLDAFDAFDERTASIAGRGSRDGGAYALAFRQSVQAVTGNLPKLRLDADSSDAQRKLAQIRADLVTLGGKTIGVDIDDTRARAELDELRLRLNTLLRDESLTVDVRADVESARRGIDDFFDGAATESDRLAARIRASFSAALSNIPAVDVDADTSQSERKLQDLRRDMALIQDLHINGELDDAQALAALSHLQRELRKVAAYSPDVTVRVHAAKAAADLQELREQASRTANSIDDIGNRSNSGIGRLAALVGTILTLGTTAVPAAAAAAAAIGGIAAAAGVAVLGIGTVALGLFGIVDAVKALNKAQEDAAASAKSTGAADNALTRSADALRNSKLNLIDVQRDSADAATGAAQRVNDAEKALNKARTDAADANTKASRQLTEAQDAELESREDLNKAIRDAQDEMRSLDLQVRQNSLDQREATTAIAKAKADLDVVLSNPRASQIEREQAQQSYEARMLQLEGLQLKGEELGRDQEEFAKKGVDASERVQNARKAESNAADKVADAEAAVSKTRIEGTDRVTKAEQTLADAHRAQAAQRRQSAQALRSAQQAVKNASLAAEQAVRSEAAAGGAAVQNLQVAMAKLSPAGQEFARYIFGLKNDFKDLTSAASTGLLPGLQAGIEGLMAYAPQIEDFVGRFSKAIGNTFVDFADSLADPTWQQFFTYFDEHAVPILGQLYVASKNLAEGVANLFLAMAPASESFLTGFVDVTRRFSDWAARLSTDNGWIEFVAYMKQSGPKIFELLESLLLMTLKILEAAAPIGDLMLGAVTAFTQMIAGMNTGFLSVILAGVAAFSVLALGVAATTGAMRLLNKTNDPLRKMFRNLQKFNAELGNDRTTRRTIDRFNAMGDSTRRASRATDNLAGSQSRARTDADRYNTAQKNVQTTLGQQDKHRTAATATGNLAGAQRNGATDATAYKNAQGNISGTLKGVNETTGIARQRVQDLDTAQRNAQTSTGRLSTLTGGLAAAGGRAVGGFKRLGTAIGNFLGPAGLVSIALVGIGAAFAAWQSHKDKQKQAVEDLTKGIADLGQAYRDTGELTSKQVQEAINADANLSELARSTSQYGVALGDVARAAAGDPGAYDEVNRQLQERLDYLKQVRLEQANQLKIGVGVVQNADGSMSMQNNKSLDELIKKTEDYKGALDRNKTSAQQLIDIQTALTSARSADAIMLETKQTVEQLKQNTALDANQAKIDAVTAKIKDHFLAANGDAAAKARLLRTALQEQTVSAKFAGDTLGDYADKVSMTKGAYDSLLGNQEDFSAQLLGMREQIKANITAHDKHARSLEFDAENLSKNSATALQNRDALRDLLQASTDMFLADIEAGANIDVARKAHEKRIEALKQESKNLRLNKGDVENLIKAQEGITDKITTDYDTKDFPKAYEELQRLNFMQEMIRQGRDATDAQKQWEAFKNKTAPRYSQDSSKRDESLYRARGGLLDGPGTKTSDSIPLWGSRGEYVHRAAAVDYYGVSAMDALNARRIPREIFKYATGGLVGRKPRPDDDANGYAAGGLVAPITVDFSKMSIQAPTEAEARAIVERQLGAAPGTTTGAVGGGHTVGSEQVAETAEAQARKMNATTKQLVALIEAGIVESTLRNLNYGDRDSVGFLQQRPSQGWGSVEQIMNVAYATRKFIEKAKRVDKQAYSAGQLAQAVQVSAFPDRYDKQEANAYAVLNRNPPYVGGYNTGGGDGGNLGGVGGRGFRWQISVLRDAFPNINITSTNSGGHADNSWHYKNRAVDFIPHTRRYQQWVYDNYGKNSLELIGPYPDLNLWHGKHHKYRADTESQHKNHIHWAYDSGGWLEPGVTQVINATRKPEAVFTNAQFQDIKALTSATREAASAMTGAGGGPVSNQIINFPNTTLTEARLNAMQSRNNSLARINRSNY